MEGPAHPGGRLGRGKEGVYVGENLVGALCPRPQLQRLKERRLKETPRGIGAEPHLVDRGV